MTRFCFLTAAALFTVAGLLALAVFPCFRTASYSLDGGTSVVRQWPFFVEDSPVGSVTWRIPMESPLWRPGALALYGAGHLHSMAVNGHEVVFSPPKVLDGHTPVQVSLEEYLKPGRNDLAFSLEKPPGRAALRLALAPLDAPYLTVIGIALAACGFALAGFHFLHPRMLPASLAAVLVLGITVRVFYTSGTIYSARAYDTSGHVGYIKYVAAKGTLPPADYGWETYQPPLYYAICATLARIVGQESNSMLYTVWQSFSLMLGIGTFLLCYPICLRLLGPPGKNAVLHVLFLAILAVYPGFVFTASRISNDSLFNFLAFLWFWLVLRAWQQPTMRNWILVALCLGVGVLTKNTTLPLIAVTACLVILQKTETFGRKVAVFGMLVGVILTISGWFLVPRILTAESPESFIAANHEGLGPGLRLERSLGNMLVFDPVAVVKLPFYSTWTDESRRMFFPEVFFKSSLFGEWIWDRYLVLPARALVITAMALLVCAFIGLFGELHTPSPNFLPVFLTGGAVFGSVALYLWRLPYACSQDFRFATLVLVPLALWVAQAAGRGRHRVMAFIVGAFCLHASLFLTALVCA